MNVDQYCARVISEAMFYEERTGEQPNAVCVSAAAYKELEEDFKALFWGLSLPFPTPYEPRLAGMRVYISDGLQGEAFFVGKLRTKTD